MSQLSHSRWKQIAAVTGGALLASGWLPAATADDDPGVGVHATMVVGNLIELALTNPGDQAASGSLTVRALTWHGVEETAVPFLVAPGQKAFVRVEMASPIVEVIELGAVVDDGAPF